MIETGKFATGSVAEYLSLTAKKQSYAMKADLKDPATQFRLARAGHSIERAEEALIHLHTLQKCADALPGVKRMSYDESFVNLVHSTLAAPTEDIIGQLSRSSFPFDRFWIEGPCPHTAVASRPYRIGMMVEADQKNHSFSFVQYNEIPLHPALLPLMKSLQEITYTIGSETRHIAHDTPLKAAVSMNGIDLDEDLILRHIDFMSKSMKIETGLNSDSTFLIDDAYKIADFLARAFVVLSSERIPNNFSSPKTHTELAQEKQNREFKRMGRPPRLPVTPLEIDVTQLGPTLPQLKTLKQVRQLLGWTSVRRSKPILKKDGTYFTRDPHDRRIAAPVDRRNIDRTLKAGYPSVTIAFEDGRAVQKSAVLKP